MADLSIQTKCKVCGTDTTFCCSGCEEAFYCSEECQRLDWRQGHGAECKELAQKRKSKASEAEKKSSVVPTRSGSRFEAVVKQAQSAARHSNAAGKIPVKPPVAGIDQALLVLRYGLLQRFGSFRAAVEWFEHHYHGKLNLEEFKNTLAMMRPGDIPGRQTVLPPGVAPYELFGAMDSDGFGEVDLVGLMHSYWDVELKGDHRGQKMSSQSVVHEDPRGHGNSSMRRAHRTAAVLAYRNARYDDAIVNAKQALRAHGSEEGDNLVELLLLSRAYAASSQHDLGVGFVDRLLLEYPIGERKHGETRHLSLHVRASLECNVAEICEMYGKHSEAEAYYQQYITTVTRGFGAESLAAGDAFNLVACFLLKRSGELSGDAQHLADALVLAQRCLTIREKLLPYPSLHVADSHCNVALLARHLQDPRLAVKHLHAALAIREALFGVDSLPVADVKYSLGLALCAIQQPPSQSALGFLMAAQSTRLKQLGSKHTDSVLATEAVERAKRLIADHSLKDCENAVGEVELSTLAAAAVDQAPITLPVVQLPSPDGTGWILNPAAAALLSAHDIPLPDMDSVGAPVWPIDFRSSGRPPPVLPLVKHDGTPVRVGTAAAMVVNPCLVTTLHGPLSSSAKDKKGILAVAKVRLGGNGVGADALDARGHLIGFFECTIPTDSASWDLARHLSRLEEYMKHSDGGLTQDEWYEAFLFLSLDDATLCSSMWDTDAWCAPLGRDTQVAAGHPELIDYATAVRDLSPTIELRLHCMYVNYFCTSVEKDRVVEDLRLILEATRQLRESQKLSTILQVIVKVGRALRSDGPTDESSANKGLRLSVVFDLVNIEGERISLVEYLVQQLRSQRPSLLQFEAELDKVLDSGRVRVPDVFDFLARFRIIVGTLSTPAADLAASRTGEGSLAEGLQRARALGEQAIDELDELAREIEHQTQGMLVQLGGNDGKSKAALLDTWPTMLQNTFERIADLLERMRGVASRLEENPIEDEDDLDEYDNEGSENSDESASVEEEYSEDGYSDGDASHG